MYYFQSILVFFTEAGTPASRVYGSLNLPVTVEPAATTELSAISVPLLMITLLPIQT
jgi:hypothetical protein